MKLKFSGHIFEKYSNIKFHKIRPVGAELFLEDGGKDGRTDMTKLIDAFRNFANAPKNHEEITGRNSSVGIATRYGLDGSGF
jgi:hypothetical protein